MNSRSAHVLVASGYLAAAVVLAACGGSFAPSAKRSTAGGQASAPGGSSPSYGAPASYDGAESASYEDGDGGYDQPMPSPDSGGLAIDNRTAPPVETPRERPGLGTVFGETISSSVTTRPFARASASPFAAVAMNYNDRDGVVAHANYLGATPQPLSVFTPGGGISIALTDVAGRELPGVSAGGKTFVIGAEGERYNLVITNQTGGRFEIVASVDGLDVIDGRPADVAKRGYILEPYATLVVDGFRRSESAVAAFRFGRVQSSYAARTSGDRNVGVVGVAFFSERGSRWTSDELQRRDTANPFPGDRDYARPPSY